MKLLELLNRYQPALELERLYRQAMIDFASQHPDCFERSNLTGHFTASAWLLNRPGDKALLLHHQKLDRWFQLGGHADGDSDLLHVAIKESQEESGIDGIEAVSPEIFDLDIHEIPANSKDPRHFHYDVRFLLRVTGSDQVISNRESKELRWIGKSRSELPTDNLSVVRMFDKWLEL